MPLADYASDNDETRCSVGLALRALSEEDRATFLDWLGTPERRGKSASVIFSDFHDWAKAEYPDLKIAYQTINRHRSPTGTCGCKK